MRSIKYAAALSGVAMLAGSLYAAPAGATTAGTKSATAAVSTAGTACQMGLRSVTAAGDLGGATVRASTPPTTQAIPLNGLHVFPAGSARLSTTWDFSRGIGSDFEEFGNVVQGPSLYNAAAYFDGATGHSSTAVVGGGWGSYKAIASSHYFRPADPAIMRNYLYGLRNDGVLFRWTTPGSGDGRDPVGSDLGARRLGSYPGFSSVKAMALISQTATYDTFLANLRGGGLYTIRIPVSSPMKAVVKRVRTSTWQVFESLVAEQCGSQGTLLTGIDKNTGSAYLYAVGHATGTTTVIQSRGKIPGTFTAPVYYLRHPEMNNLNGE